MRTPSHGSDHGPGHGWTTLTRVQVTDSATTMMPPTIMAAPNTRFQASTQAGLTTSLPKNAF